MQGFIVFYCENYLPLGAEDIHHTGGGVENLAVGSVPPKPSHQLAPCYCMNSC